jgi:hypothetical protein
LDQTDDAIINQILQENQPKSSPLGEENDDDERVWNTFNDVISQVPSMIVSHDSPHLSSLSLSLGSCCERRSNERSTL